MHQVRMASKGVLEPIEGMAVAEGEPQVSLFWILISAEVV